MICQKPKSDDNNSKNDRNIYQNIIVDVARSAGSIPIALPYTTDDTMVQQNLDRVVPDFSVIESKVQTICDFTGEDDKEFVNFVLEEKNYNEVDVIEEFLDKDVKDKY